MEDPRIYNIRDVDERYLCPGCGLPGYFEGDSYTDWGGVAGTGSCPCCYWEPGVTDQPIGTYDHTSILEALRLHRSGWSSLGPAWSGDPSDIPHGWDGRAQLAHLFEVAPHVR